MATAMGNDTYYMELALAEAARAASMGEVPVGAIVVDREGRVLGRGHNQRETRGDPVGHAEIYALQAAAKALGNWRLTDAALYVTLEPCPMCAGAAVNARIKRLVYGCDDPKAGAMRSLYELGGDSRLNHQIEVTAGVLSAQCGARLSGFFAHLRSEKT